MTRLLRVSATLLVTVALSGCASIFGHGFADRSSSRAAPVQIDVGNIQLAAARQAMDAGMTAEAIDLFRAAQADPQTMPAASNGLGVAYARLGRFDLADRYFRMAMALDPANQRYAANMLRMQGDYALAQAREAEATRLAQAEKPVEAAPVEVAVAERPGALERVSRGEVHIRTAPVAASRPTAVVASRDALPMITTGKLAGKPAAAKVASGYPVRIDLSKHVSSAGGDPASVEYPQRVDLSKVVLVD
jgi:tetratricopeptide (TPR) repeat protein